MHPSGAKLIAYGAVASGSPEYGCPSLGRNGTKRVSPCRVQAALQSLAGIVGPFLGLSGHPTTTGSMENMIDKQFFEDLSQQITRLISQSGAVGEDLRKAVNSTLQKGFSRLDLLTREEFDAQSAILSRAEERMVQLEREVARLEQQVNALQSDRPRSADPE